MIYDIFLLSAIFVTICAITASILEADNVMEIYEESLEKAFPSSELKEQCSKIFNEMILCKHDDKKTIEQISACREKYDAECGEVGALTREEIYRTSADPEAYMNIIHPPPSTLAIFAMTIVNNTWLVGSLFLLAVLLWIFYLLRLISS